MDTFGSILADAKRSREEAFRLIEAVTAGTAPLAPGMTRERALMILQENMADYDAIIRRFGWRDNA